ncbi:MAG: amidohydrolase family protein, partial [Cellulosilyticaceae bacterium]
MEYLIIDSHMHLWDQLTGCVNGMTIKSLGEGKSTFIGGDRQMMPPYMIDGRNTVEMFIANMNYSGVAGAVVTQEYIDGNQNEYLLKVKGQYPNKFKVCGLLDHRLKNEILQVQSMIRLGFDGIKIVAQRMIENDKWIKLNTPEYMKCFQMMEQENIFLSIDLADGKIQVEEIREIIESCPRLRIAIGHFGMVGRADWQEQIKLARYPNVVIESGGITWLFHKEFYPYRGAVDAIKEAAELVGMEKLLWGSDYPRTMTAITYKMSWDFMNQTSELKIEDKEKFLGLNAKQFYQFKGLSPQKIIKN